jgi:drug/metabolite transporter (DMT)-like permease
MSAGIGIGLAFVAMLCWGFGDFLIQRSTRKIGNWETLFAITAFGSVVLFPFVYKDIPTLFTPPYSGLGVLVVSSIVLFGAALLDFEALRIGKLAVVEPIWSFEIPAAALFAFFILGERLSWIQIILATSLIGGLILVSLRSRITARMLFEKGVFISFVAAISMGAASFFMGWGARETDPLMANFFTALFIAVGCLIYFIRKGKFRHVLRDINAHKALLLPMSIADNTAWVAFATAMVFAPIGIAVALSESYIIFAVILGLAVNKEKLKRHQFVGLVIALISAIILAAITAS